MRILNNQNKLKKCMLILINKKIRKPINIVPNIFKNLNPKTSLSLKRNMYQNNEIYIECINN